MKALSSEDVRNVVVELFGDSFRAHGFEPSHVPADCDLLGMGIIDSLGVVRMVAAIEEEAGGEIDFEALDFEDMTVLGKFCDYVAKVTAMNGAAEPV